MTPLLVLLFFSLVLRDVTEASAVTCLDDELTLLSLNVASFKGIQGALNETLHARLAAIETKVGLLSAYTTFPLDAMHDARHAAVPRCSLFKSNQAYQEKVKVFLTAVDSDVVTVKKRGEDLIALYATRLTDILAHLNATETYA